MKGLKVLSYKDRRGSVGYTIPRNVLRKEKIERLFKTKNPSK